MGYGNINAVLLIAQAEVRSNIVLQLACMLQRACVMHTYMSLLHIPFHLLLEVLANLGLIPCLELACFSTLTRDVFSIWERCILPYKGFSTVGPLEPT